MFFTSFLSSLTSISQGPYQSDQQAAVNTSYDIVAVNCRSNQLPSTPPLDDIWRSRWRQTATCRDIIEVEISAARTRSVAIIIDNSIAARNPEIQTSPRDYSESVVAKIDPISEEVTGSEIIRGRIKWASIYSGLLVRHFQMAREKGQENAANFAGVMCAISWAGGTASGPRLLDTGGPSRGCTTSRAFLNG